MAESRFNSVPDNSANSLNMVLAAACTLGLDDRLKQVNSGLRLNYRRLVVELYQSHTTTLFDPGLYDSSPNQVTQASQMMIQIVTVYTYDFLQLDGGILVGLK